MKNIKSILLLTTISVLLFSCEKLVTETNYQDDPNTVGSVPTVNLISQAELVATYLAESDASRYAGIMSNSITGADAQWIGYEQYRFTPTDFDALWSNIYVEGIKTVRLAKEQALEEEDNDAFATAAMLEAYFLGEMATSFGAVPDSEASVAGIDFPVYDAQASVLAHVQTLLDDAIAAAGGSTLYISDENGSTRSTSTLGQIAHSFKARYYMISKNYPMALSEAQAGISNVGGDFFSLHTSATGAQNFWYNFTVLARPANTTPVGSYLQELIDPSGSANRLLATPGEAARYAFYYRDNGNFGTTEGQLMAQDASLPIISWYETQLILAEAAQRGGNNTLAQNTLNSVRAALDAQYGGGFPPSAATGGTLLLHILEEKYITLYPSPQTWHDLTRTDNILGVPLKTGSQLPERFLYSQTELDVNPNTPQPIPTLFTPTPVNQ
ncbi:SusD/RagB family nutrient-binding outer membrane lipoprotein [Altibacter sp.]|uniref:SusD/RagB family nutrient-binding outer membrane lipoprotein n=1 Tax=Altibacter sp. TaxID=2024823 RepID=UPI000C944CB3|nr:SusD/RagB family nutrient-binding outer membrane lipoprotein [Altibacter sp.]MAP55177.1 RagB/SusD family nutrient uptake outer membrane protein [Altibacter sp.]